MKSRVSLLLLAAALLAADAGVPIPEQARLGGLLQAAARSGFPIRVAIIATPSDLGAVTGLWQKPRAYARFLGIELSLAFSGRLVVVMPNGLGYNWPGHSAAAAYRTLSHITVGRGGLAANAQVPVLSLATAAGIKPAGATPASAHPPPVGQRPAPSTGGAAPGASVDTLVAIIAVALAAATEVAVLARRRLGSTPRVSLRVRQRVDRPRVAVAVGAVVLVRAGAAMVALLAIGSPTTAATAALVSNPSLDPGTPLTRALFVIDPKGRERRLYITQQSYAAVDQLGQLLAQEASSLLSGHPKVNSKLSYAQVGGISPANPVTLAAAGGGSVHLGPGRPRAYAFFATWDRQITGLAAGLERLGRYSRLARRLGLPELEAVDEATVEPAGALGRFLATLPHPLPYPVAIDRDGRLARRLRR